jgi:hypothetical protein
LETSLNDDHPGEMPVDSSKSSMKASAWEVVRTRVPVPAQTPVVGSALPLEEPLLPPPDEDPELEPDPPPPPDELALPDELPLPELGPPSALAGAEPVEHAPAIQKLVSRNDTQTDVSAILDFKCRMFFPAPGQRGHPTVGPRFRPERNASKDV